MRRIHTFIRLMLCSYLMSAGIVSVNALPDADQENDLAEKFLAETAWDSSLLPGEWRDVSVNSGQRISQLTELAPVFGVVPQQIQAYYDDNDLASVEIVYLEAGLFFGSKESRKLRTRLKNTRGSRERRALEKQIRNVQRKERKTSRGRSKEFGRKFKELARILPAGIAQICGDSGKSIRVGKDRLLRSRVIEYLNQTLSLRLLIENDQLISLTITQQDDATRGLLSRGRNMGDRAGRKKSVKDNVTELENGDVLIDDIPMFNQGGRGYCAMGTLAMITRYYGLNVNIDLLAAKAGYKEGDVAKAKLLPIYNAAAREAKLKLRQLRKFNFRETQRIIRKGQPILVWRVFNYERNKFHSEFAQRYAKNPTALLPDPRKDKKEKRKWPTFDSGGRHASLITGFNKERKEVLFTESWGEQNRNRRMRAEEMESTVYQMFIFTP